MILRRRGQENAKDISSQEIDENSKTSSFRRTTSDRKTSSSRKTRSIVKTSSLKKIISFRKKDGFKKTDSKNAGVEAPSSIHVDVPELKAELLKRLKKQHRHINQLQKTIEKTRLKTDQDLRDASSLINDFKKAFEAHILLEQSDFYNYLENMLADDVSRAKDLKSSRQDLNRVINNVLRYCSRYNSAQKIRQRKEDFQKDARDLRQLVKKRSRLEERELFPAFTELD